MTANQARLRENARIEQEMTANRSRAGIAEQELALRRKTGEEAVNNARQESLNLYGDVNEANRVANEEQLKQNQLIREAQGEVNKLDQEYQDLAISIKTSGEELRRTFSESLARLFEDSVFAARKAMDNLKAFGESIGRQIIGGIAKRAADSITKRIVEASSQRDEKTGEIKKGTSIFDKIGGFLFGESKPDGSTDEKALRVRLIAEQAARMGGGTGPFAPNLPFPQAQTLFAGLTQAAGRFSRMDVGGVVGLGIGLLFGSGGGGRSGSQTRPISRPPEGSLAAAEGGPVSGPGTGTSDSIPAMLSAGEHVMPAAKAAQFMPLLEGIRTGKILPFVKGGIVQSIAIASIIPRRYAGGGMVSDGGASTVQTGGGAGNMVVSLHPDALNLTMREWLEHEVVRQQGRR